MIWLLFIELYRINILIQIWWINCQGWGSVYFKKMDPYPYLGKYSPDVLKTKTKCLEILNVDKKCFIKI